MKRLTQKDHNGTIIAYGTEQEIIERLYYYEDRIYTLLARSEFAKQQLRELRRAGKEHTARYKELLGDELVGNTIIGAIFPQEK